MTEVKICGITTAKEAEFIRQVKPDYTGMVMYFPKSKRNISEETAKELINVIGSEVKKVAVTVSPTVMQAETISSLGFDFIQIHGELPEEVFNAVKIPVIRAFNDKNLEEVNKYKDNEKIYGLLFDAAEPGSGKSFDWTKMEAIKAVVADKKIFLAGGLSPDNVAEAILKVSPDVVDVSSGVENDNGIGKDFEKITRFINNSKQSAPNARMELIMKKPDITKNKVKTLLETKFIKLFDLQYEEGKHYFDATRRNADNIVAIKSDDEFKSMLPDAVTCFLILKVKGEEPKLVLFYEYRYPTGQFLLSPPAGLIDPQDINTDEPQINTAKREIFEETGIRVKDSDKIELINPLAFSSPGMTDESNGIVCAVVELEDLSDLTQSGAEGSECFNGFKLLTQKEAKEVLKNGRDEYGNFFSIFTWAALTYFVTGLWE